jgi:hypothetical protein
MIQVILWMITIPPAYDATSTKSDGVKINFLYTFLIQA